MSYTPNTWAAGDIVTAAKLNNLEQGVANAGGVTIIYTTYSNNGSVVTLNSTAAAILQAFHNGLVLVKYEDETGYEEECIVRASYSNETGYSFSTRYYEYYASAGTDYPSAETPK